MTRTIPEERLWKNVLEHARNDLLKNKKPRLREKARAWFKEDVRKFPNELCNIESCDPQAGSFMWICMALNLDTKKTREAVLKEDDLNELIRKLQREKRG